MLRFLLFFLLFPFSGSVFSAPQWWSGTQGQGQIYSSASASCDAALAAHPGGATLFSNKTLTLVNSDVDGPKQFTCAALAYYREPASTDPNKFNFSTSITRNTGTNCGSNGMMDTATGACIDLTSVCNSKSGLKEDSVQLPVVNGETVNGCLGGCAVARSGSAVLVDGATNTVTSVKYTGATCAASGVSSPAVPPPQGQTCGTINGKTLCLTSSNPNCGTVDGKNICLETAPSGSCTYLPGGSYICDSVAPDDVTHKPIDGNGNYIKPDMTLISGPDTTSGRDADYWGSGTMSNASNGTDADAKGNKVGDCVGASCTSGDGEQEGASFPGGGQFQPGEGTGQFPGDETDAEITAARQQLSDLVGSIRSQISGMFSNMVSEGAGQLPCSDQVEILGKTIQFCFSDYESSLIVFRSALLFIVLVICLLLVLGAWR